MTRIVHLTAMRTTQPLVARLVLVFTTLLTLVSGSDGAESTRPSFGARLEPTDGRVLIGAGQRPEGFKDYYDSIGTNKPVVYMTYMRLNAADTPARFAKLKEELENYPETFLIPPIGLSMTGSRKPEEHYEHKVAAGELDAQIDQFCAGLKDLGRPAFVRIGYEFNGHWNGYKPATYRAAFRRVTEKMRQAGLENVATVWRLGSGAKIWDFMSFYPGDDVVDWWAIDMFEADHMRMKKTKEFMAAAMFLHGADHEHTLRAPQVQA